MGGDPGELFCRVAVSQLTFHVAVKQFECLGTAGIGPIGLQEPL
jgi:hypothetical protein